MSDIDMYDIKLAMKKKQMLAQEDIIKVLEHHGMLDSTVAIALLLYIITSIFKINEISYDCVSGIFEEAKDTYKCLIEKG
jgi:hypothetical protein